MAAKATVHDGLAPATQNLIALRTHSVSLYLPSLGKIVLLHQPFPGWITILLMILLEGGALSSQEGEGERRLWGWMSGIRIVV